VVNDGYMRKAGSLDWFLVIKSHVFGRRRCQTLNYILNMFLLMDY
jgi:hypothetical protein